MNNMLRGEKSVAPDNAASRKRRNARMAAADIIDDQGYVHFRIVSSGWAKIVIVSIVTLLLVGILVLGLVLYNKSEIDELKRQSPAVENSNQ